MDWLDQLGVAYEHIDVEADAEAKAEMLAKNGGEFLVPVTVIGSDTVAGFDRPAVKKALDKHGIKHA